METKLIVKGMMCENCKRHVYEALIQVEGVKAVEIDLKKKTVLVQANEEISIDTLKEAVLKAGYVAK